MLQEVDVKSMTGGLINNYFLCGGCGCPLQGKMFTPKGAPKEQKCPQGKWKD
jgi:hypothetical protein